MTTADRASDAPLRFLSERQYAHWRQMPGFLLEAAGERLYQAAIDAPGGGHAVELGTFAGKSMVCLANGVRARPGADALPLVAIDKGFHSAWPDTVQRFDLGSLVTAVEQSSLDAADTWNEPISLLYIDANHGPGHARADFVVWEFFVVEGGIIALDDTAGFFPGCTHQVQMALAGGRYEPLDEVGGVTFLRKRAPLFDGIGVAPLQRESAFVAVVAASAWSGAMDPGLRLPNPMRFRLSDELITERLRGTLVDLHRTRERSGPLRERLDPTIAYLEAVVRLRLGDAEASRSILEDLARSDVGALYHYDLALRPLVLLRLAQVLDTLGQRDVAFRRYEQVLEATTIDGVRDAAMDGLARPFELPEPTTGRLLREYVIDSPLYRYRRPHAPKP
jgi:predicted O-methyltransferase YrrM